MSIIDPAIVRVENLQAWLRQSGYEVVSGEWLRGHSYPVLFVRPIEQPAGQPALLVPPICNCQHGLAVHDGRGGMCLAVNCACNIYDPRSTHER